MFISLLKTKNFRNLEDVKIELAPGINLFVGENGQGKTNILESAYILGTGKTFRSSKPKECVKWNKEDAIVEGFVRDLLGETKLTIRLSEQKKEARINDNLATGFSDFIGKLLIVAFYPDELEIVRGGALLRRQLIDKLIVDINPTSLGSIVSYQRALKNKQALLRERRATPKTLEPWNYILAKEGLNITKLRVEAVQKLLKNSTEIYRLISGEAETLSLKLKNSLSENITEDEAINIINESSQKDILTGIVSIGPHKDDLEIELNKKSARKFSSQGQARSVVLSIKSAIVDLLKDIRKEPPVVLLDDVNSELDKSRGERFLSFLLEHELQTIVTTTDAHEESFKNFKQISHFEVKKGVVIKKED